MSKLLVSVTSTEPATGRGSVKIIMPSSSEGDAQPDLESPKEGEEGEDFGDHQATLQLQHVAGDGQAKEQENRELEGITEEEEVYEEEEEEEEEGENEEEGGEEEEEGGEEEEEDLGDEGEEESASEETEELESEPEPEEEEEDEGEEEDEQKTGSVEGIKYEIEVDEIQPEVEFVEEEEVEEYEYTKEEIQYMKTAFVAYQIEKARSRQSTRRPDKKKAVKTTEIPISTLGSVLRSLGLNPTELALKSYREWLGADPRKGTVKFEELLIIVGREKKVIIDESHVLEAFRFIDVEKVGVIPIELLKGLLVDTGERFTPEEWIIFVHLADRKKTKIVDYENFVQRMGPNPPIPEKKKKKKKKKKGKKR